MQLTKLIAPCRVQLKRCRFAMRKGVLPSTRSNKRPSFNEDLKLAIWPEHIVFAVLPLALWHRCVEIPDNYSWSAALSGWRRILSVFLAVCINHIVNVSVLSLAQCQLELPSTGSAGFPVAHSRGSPCQVSPLMKSLSSPVTDGCSWSWECRRLQLVLGMSTAAAGPRNVGINPPASLLPGKRDRTATPANIQQGTPTRV